MIGKTTSAALVGLAACVLSNGSPSAQQGLCYHKTRHITCHFPDNKTVVYETDANTEFYNVPPYMTFRTPDGSVHNIIGNCEIVCKP